MRLIDAEAFLDFLRIEEKIMEGEEITFDYVRSLIVSAPTIEAKPVVCAHWENIFCLITPYDDDDYEEARCKCSNCTMITDFEYDYCPYCGAQMDEGVKIPVISMEDVPKIMEELPSVEENPILKAVKEMEK